VHFARPDLKLDAVERADSGECLYYVAQPEYDRALPGVVGWGAGFRGSAVVCQRGGSAAVG
jgi:hypothetical protein